MSTGNGALARPSRDLAALHVPRVLSRLLLVDRHGNVVVGYEHGLSLSDAGR
jgi:hypothetical protein